MTEAQFPHQNCETQGHHFFMVPFTFARDMKGIAFQGEGFKPAQKFMRLFCSRCLATAEIEVCPRSEVRQPSIPKPKTQAEPKIAQVAKR